jgi:hypothetical protein
VDDILIGFCITFFIMHVPIKDFEERINELETDLGLVIVMIITPPRKYYYRFSFIYEIIRLSKISSRPSEFATSFTD